VRAPSARAKSFMVERWDLRKRVGVVCLLFDDDDDADDDGVIGEEKREK
jgi:hypothetical protein